MKKGESYIRLLCFQNEKYKLEVDNQIYTYLSQLQYLEEDDLYNKSLECKPLSSSNSMSEDSPQNSKREDLMMISEMAGQKTKKTSNKVVSNVKVVSNPLLMLKSPKKSVNELFDDYPSPKSPQYNKFPREITTRNSEPEIFQSAVPSTPPIGRSTPEMSIRSRKSERLFGKKSKDDSNNDKSTSEKTPEKPKHDRWRNSYNLNNYKVSLSKSYSQSSLNIVDDLVIVCHSSNSVIKKIFMNKSNFSWREFKKKICSTFALKPNSDFEMQRFTDMQKITKKKHFLNYLNSLESNTIQIRVSFKDSSPRKRIESDTSNPLTPASVSPLPSPLRSSRSRFEKIGIFVTFEDETKNVTLLNSSDYSSFRLLVLNKFKIFETNNPAVIKQGDVIVDSNNIKELLLDQANFHLVFDKKKK